MNIPKVPWVTFSSIINTYANNNTALKPVTWIRSSVSPIPKMGTDNDISFKSDIELLALIEYNVKRVWPLTNETDTGEEDRQSLVAMFNLSYLDGLGYLDSDKNFAYNSGEDEFLIDGLRYHSGGDTKASQVEGSDLWYMIIMKRADYST